MRIYFNPEIGLCSALSCLQLHFTILCIRSRYLRNKVRSTLQLRIKYSALVFNIEQSSLNFTCSLNVLSYEEFELYSGADPDIPINSSSRRERSHDRINYTRKVPGRVREWWESMRIEESQSWGLEIGAILDRQAVRERSPRLYVHVFLFSGMLLRRENARNFGQVRNFPTFRDQWSTTRL